MVSTIINLFAGPGAGKSTTAAGLFHLMRMQGHSVELVTEYAKDLTYEKNTQGLGNQLTILGEQFNRLWRLKDQVDWVITDSPLPLGLLYSSGPFSKAWFTAAVMGAFESFDNRCFFIDRKKEYVAQGRNQTEDEAKQIDLRVRGLLDAFSVEYHRVQGTAIAPKLIMEEVLK